LAWSGVPAQAGSLALVVEDPDAPTPEPFLHWLVYNLGAQVRSIPENVAKVEVAREIGGATQGKNSSLKIGWTGMAPPKGDVPHRYFFQLFALDQKLALEPGVGRTALFDAMDRHVVARGKLIGTYQR
jgi:hypothetical protein